MSRREGRQLCLGLTGLETVMLLPHVGSATVETRTRMALMAAENPLAGLRGGPPSNCLKRTEIKRELHEGLAFLPGSLWSPASG